MEIFVITKLIGILGGSFNPPHLGHLQMAKVAKTELGLDEVWLLVSPQNPHKTKNGMAPFDVRFRLCENLSCEYQWLNVSDFEHQNNCTYTAETLQKLTEQHNDCQFVWIMGSDNWQNFHKWDNWQDILNLVPVVIVNRTAIDGSTINHLTTKSGKEFATYQTQVEDRLEPVPNWRVINMQPHPGRATDIRLNLKQGADAVFLPPPRLKGIEKYYDFYTNAVTHK